MRSWLCDKPRADVWQVMYIQLTAGCVTSEEPTVWQAEGWLCDKRCTTSWQLAVWQAKRWLCDKRRADCVTSQGLTVWQVMHDKLTAGCVTSEELTVSQAKSWLCDERADCVILLISCLHCSQRIPKIHVCFPTSLKRKTYVISVCVFCFWGFWIRTDEDGRGSSWYLNPKRRNPK